MRIARGISIANASKPISTAPVYDADAVAFFTAANITDTTQKSAVNTLVLSLKSANIWSKMKALYPVVGGVASSHAVNLKSPGTYNLTFATGWTHATTGMTPNGATYADTFFNPSGILTLNSTHNSYYSRTNVAEAGFDMGAVQNVGGANVNIYNILISRNTGNSAFFGINVNEANIPSASISNSDSRGLFVANRTASNVLNGFRNSTKIFNSSIVSSAIPNKILYLGAVNANGAQNYSNKQCAFASIGDGLTDAEASSFYTAVQTYQTTLGRQV